MEYQRDMASLLSWCFEPSQPHRITSGLNTNFNLSPSYPFHKSLHHKWVRERENTSFSFIFCIFYPEDGIEWSLEEGKPNIFILPWLRSFIHKTNYSRICLDFTLCILPCEFVPSQILLTSWIKEENFLKLNRITTWMATRVEIN